MKEYRGRTTDGKPIAMWPDIHKECASHERFIITVDKFDEEREISKQQMKYLYAVVFPALAEYMGCSKLMAEITLKRKCGAEWLVKEIDKAQVILSKKSLSVKKTTLWMENIMDFMETIGCPVPPPDKDWRLNKEK